MNKKSVVLIVCLIIVLVLSACVSPKPNWKVYDVTCFGNWNKLVTRNENETSDMSNWYIYPSGEKVLLPVSTGYAPANCVYILTNTSFDGNFHK
jgi:hypothetical protein